MDLYKFKGQSLGNILTHNNTINNDLSNKFTGIPNVSTSTDVYKIYNDNTLPFIYNGSSIFKNAVVKNEIYNSTSSGIVTIPEWATGVKININGSKGDKGDKGPKGQNGDKGASGAPGEGGATYNGAHKKYRAEYRFSGHHCPGADHYSATIGGGSGGAGGEGGEGGQGGEGGDGGDGGDGGQYFMTRTVILNGSKQINIGFNNGVTSAEISNLLRMNVNKGIKGVMGTRGNSAYNGNQGSKGTKGVDATGGSDPNYANCEDYKYNQGQHGNHTGGKMTDGSKGTKGSRGDDGNTGSKGEKGGVYTISSNGSIETSNNVITNDSETVEVYYFIL